MLVTAISAGNWSDPTIWDNGTGVGSTDDADLAGYAVTMDVDIICGSITDSVGSPNGLTVSSSNLTANLVAVSAGTLIQLTGSYALNFIGTFTASDGNVFLLNSGSTLVATGYGTLTGASTDLLVCNGSCTITLQTSFGGGPIALTDGATLLAAEASGVALTLSSCTITLDGTAELIANASNGPVLTFGGGTTISGLNAGTVPAAGDVRSGTTVGFGTGTLAVPLPTKVLLATATDATTGSLVSPGVGSVASGVVYGVGGAGSTGTAVLTAAAAAAAILDAAASAHNTSGTIGAFINTAATGVLAPLDVANALSIFPQSSPQAGSVNYTLANVFTKVNALPNQPAAIGSQMDLVNAPNATALTAIAAAIWAAGTRTLTSLGTVVADTAAAVWAAATRAITGYVGNTPQTGDAYARLGAPAGGSTSADLASVASQTAKIGQNSGDSANQQTAQGAAMAAAGYASAAATAASAANTAATSAATAATAASTAATAAGATATAIKIKTDQLHFTVANQVDANALTGGGGGGGLTQQQVADALKLAPTVGTPAAGSVYAGVALTPAAIAAVAAAAAGGGTGPVPITSDTGADGSPSPDFLQYTNAQGVGIGGATVLIYLATDYPANPANVQAQAITQLDGTWGPLFVQHGTYVALFTKPGSSGPDVSAPFTV